MENKRELLYLAALLHDIGKFYQRASDKWQATDNNLSETSKNLAEHLCPLNQPDTFGYRHSVWTAEFLLKYEDIFKKASGIATVCEQGNANSLVRLSAYHHKPDSELSALLSLADWWSAGVDRSQQIEKENDDAAAASTEIKWGKERYKKIPLLSVFNEINSGAYYAAFPLRTLDLTGDCFPKKIEQVSDGITQQQYKALWDKFVEEFKKLPTDSFHVFAESLLYLFKKYTWCIPSNTTDMGNVSLFEHLKTTAAFADCLYLYKEENPDDFTFNKATNRLKANDNVCPVILFGGDLSGIQKFLYNITSCKAALSLKGRSFYLQLLIDSAIQRIITHPDIDAHIGNVVYSSGGKFYMLLPNTEKVKDAIAEIKKGIEQELWNDQYGQLSLNMDYVAFAYGANSNEINIETENGKTIGDLWKMLADRLSEQKSQKFKSLIEENFDAMFEPVKFDADVKVCAVTGIESGNCVKIDVKEKDSPYVLPLVRWQTGLGKTLKDVDFVLTGIDETNNGYLADRSKCNDISFGVNTFFFNNSKIRINIDENEENEENKINVTSANCTRIKKINNTDFLTDTPGNQKAACSFQFYGGNKQALNAEGIMKTFEDLAKNDKFEDTYFAVLRMDVDNLGAIFIKGLPKKQRSFSAYATLSFLLDWFFSGYLNTIRNSNEFKDDVNILYSGGDDIFAVGRWDKLIEFAHEVRTEFEKFVGRPDISVSGGIVMVGSSFPIAKAAEMAGEAERKAKQFDGKNAFNLFGRNISWGERYKYVLGWKKRFVEKCSNEKMPRSILHKIMFFAELKAKGEMKYVWHTAYYLKRFKERDKNNKDLKQFCDELQREVLGNPCNYELMAVAARWAELELKDKN